MAATIVNRAADIAWQMKKLVSGTAFALFPDGVIVNDKTTLPTVSTGSGAPTEAAPNGSLYTRTDATDGDDALYVRVAAAWVPILGQTA